jgi:hypothetical protein
VNKRTTHRSSKGPKLYAVRDSKGRFEDIQMYQRIERRERKRMESKKIEFSVDREDYPALAEYAKAKGHRSVSNLARYAVYTIMARNPMGRHDRRGAPQHRGSGGNPEEGTES